MYGVTLGLVYPGRTPFSEQKRSIHAFASSNISLAALSVRLKSEILLYKVPKSVHNCFTVGQVLGYKNS